MAKFGWTMTALIVLFVVAASVVPTAAAMTFIVWSPGYLVLIGSLELLFIILYAIPRTSLLSAVLMTALLGGAMASHMRAGSPIFSHTLFSVYSGVLMGVSLWLRQCRPWNIPWSFWASNADGIPNR